MQCREKVQLGIPHQIKWNIFSYNDKELLWKWQIVLHCLLLSQNFLIPSFVNYSASPTFPAQVM